MALIKCSECGKDVSDKAAACPGCGNPIHSKSLKPTTAPMLGKSTKELLLEKELGQVGIKADSISGAGGKIMGTVLDTFGGRLGTEWVSKKMATSEHSDTVVYGSGINNAVANVRVILTNLGKMIDTKIESDVPFLAAVIGSGFLNMNPAIVCLEFISVDDTATQIVISATAKEGLIKQKTAEKIVVRLKKLLGEG